MARLPDHDQLFLPNSTLFLSVLFIKEEPMRQFLTLVQVEHKPLSFYPFNQRIGASLVTHMEGASLAAIC